MTSGEDTSTLDGETPAPGIIWVASRTTQPTLKPADFVDWYENVHVQEVMDTGGVPGATRFTLSARGSVDPAGLGEYAFLTVYCMPDVTYRFTPQFKSLDGQSKPKGDMLERIFSKARFATRFCALTEVAPQEDIERQKPASYLVVCTVEAGQDVKGVGEKMNSLDGFVRCQVFEQRAGTVLSEFSREDGVNGTIVMVGVEGSGQMEKVGEIVGKYGKVVELAEFKAGRRYGCWE